MAEFIITTSDSTHTYTSTDSVQIVFESEANNIFSDTQGYLRKVQRGRDRIRATVLLGLTQSNYEDIFLPIFTYQDTVIVTFDRDIPGRGTATGTFLVESVSPVQEFNNGTELEVELKLTEVLETS